MLIDFPSITLIHFIYIYVYIYIYNVRISRLLIPQYPLSRSFMQLRHGLFHIYSVGVERAQLVKAQV